MLERKTVSQCVSEDYCMGWNDAVDAMPKWISVKDRLPQQDSQSVLCVMKGYADAYVCEGIYCKTCNRIWPDNEDYAFDDVTHWMTMPEPPEEG